MMGCRLCGCECSRSAGASRDLFDGRGTPLRPLHRMIRALFCFRVKRTDATTKICTKCIQLVNEYYDFHKRVKSVQVNLVNSSKKKSLFAHNIKSENGSFDNCVENDFQSDLNSTKVTENNIHHPFIKEEFHADTFEIDSDKLEKNVIFTLENNVENLEVKPNLNDLVRSELINSEFSDCNSFDDYQNCNAENFHIVGKVSKKANKNSTIRGKQILKKRKLKKKKSLLQDSEDSLVLDDIKNREDYFTFPTEIIKDGKLIVKGTSLEDLIAKFYNLHCNLCSVISKFQNLKMLMKHYNLEHHTQGYVVCCNTRFHQHRSIYMHMARHLQPSAFECPICKKAVSRPHSLKLHLQTHLPEDEKPHKCDECFRRFSYIEGLLNHKRSHIPTEERDTLYCQICGKMFTLASSFATHMRVMHSAVKYLCSECGRSFRRKTELTFHMLTHDATGKNRVKCQQCGFVCKNQPTLKIHMKRHSIDRLQCSMCDYTTHRRQQLNIHMRVKHSDDKPFVCVVCGKQFKLKSVLTTHMAQHTGEHKYSCAYCPKKFVSSGNYHSHRKRMHAEEYENDKLLRLKEQFKKLESNDIENTPEDKSLAHELARECLKKIAENNSSKKSTAL
ncbi:uncharacterized protein LOC143910826 [Arctopsyche grandis]|uniref:uncharacterized protein LOC143910826 n=1 Tax=Arctopsyche grandis TaxID=121162 RepID=UPI00406D9BC9